MLTSRGAARGPVQVGLRDMVVVLRAGSGHCCSRSSPFLQAPQLSHLVHLLVQCWVDLVRPSSLGCWWVIRGPGCKAGLVPVHGGAQPPDHSPLPDIDKVMINLKTEEFVLDMNTLQALQQLLQWVGDFVLYLLASLPNQVCPLPQDPWR